MMFMKLSDLAIFDTKSVDLTKKKQDLMKHRNLLLHIRMGKKILNFGDIEIKKKIILPPQKPYSKL